MLRQTLASTRAVRGALCRRQLYPAATIIATAATATATATIIIRCSKQQQQQQRLHSSSSSAGRRSQKAALLRATRKSTKPSSSEGQINYRFRQDDSNNNNSNNNNNYYNNNYNSTESNATFSIASMWGKDNDIDTTTNDEGASKPFVPFFHEVDAHMGIEGAAATTTTTTSRSHSSNNKSYSSTKTTLETLFDSLEDEDGQQSPASLLRSPETGRQRSIFDAFPIPAPAAAAAMAAEKRSIHAYDYESYQQYGQLLELVLINDPKNKLDQLSPVAKEWLERDEPLLTYQLPSLDQTVQEGRAATAGSIALREELEQQRVAFVLAVFGETDCDAEAQFKTLLEILVRIGRQCAKQANALPVSVAWEKIKEAGIILNNDSLSNFLHVASTYGSTRGLRTSGNRDGASPMESILNLLQPNREEEENSVYDDDGSNNNNDDDDEPEKKAEVDVAAEVAAFHDNLYPPSEQSLSVRVKAMVRMGNAKAAEALLLENSDMENLRLRTYQPILRLYVDQGDMSSALSLFKLMRDTPSVILEAETYVQLIAAMAENGFFHPINSQALDGAVELGFDPPCGPGLMDQLVSALAEDVIQITPALAKRLHTAMTKAFKQDQRGQNLEELHPLAPLPLDSTPAGSPDDVLACRVEIDTATGTCPKSGAHLRLINLDLPQRQRLKTGLLDLSVRENERFTKNHKPRKGGGRPQADPWKELERFSNFLDKRNGKPFTAIIDGANIGYYLQNFDDGKFNYHQIQFMVETLERINENPLVVLPRKYTRNYFNIHQGGNNVRRQVVTNEEFSIINALQDQGKLYVTPPNCLDDHFWMIASISEQAQSRRGASLDVLPDDAQGRWPGTRPMLLSNDQMRDHKLELIEPRLFRRWYSSHIVNYNFTGFVRDECVDDNISFSPADFFSREIQGNSPSFDGDSKNDGSTVWHFPVSEWKESERFCLRIPKK